jgi:hypothetical protein
MSLGSVLSRFKLSRMTRDLNPKGGYTEGLIGRRSKVEGDGVRNEQEARVHCSQD